MPVGTREHRSSKHRSMVQAPPSSQSQSVTQQSAMGCPLQRRSEHVSLLVQESASLQGAVLGGLEQVPLTQTSSVHGFPSAQSALPVQLSDTTARRAEKSCATVPPLQRLGDPNVPVLLDLLHQGVDTHVVGGGDVSGGGSQVHLAESRPRRVPADPIAPVVGQHVLHEGLLGIRRVEDPVRLAEDPQEGHFEVRGVLVPGLEEVLLLREPPGA